MTIFYEIRSHSLLTITVAYSCLVISGVSCSLNKNTTLSLGFQNSDILSPGKSVVQKVKFSSSNLNTNVVYLVFESPHKFISFSPDSVMITENIDYSYQTTSVKATDDAKPGKYTLKCSAKDASGRVLIENTFYITIK